MELQEFKILLEKYKSFRELPKQYKSIKFCKLYYKMYNYIISIPKEKIVIMKIVQRNNYVQYLFSYIYKFIEAKDFYNWKERIYSLLTEKYCSTEPKKYKLLYGSKWKEFLEATNKKIIDTLEEHYGSGITNPQQSKEVQEKTKATNLELYGYDNPMKAKEIQEKVSINWKNKTEEEKEQIREKQLKTLEEKYGKGITSSFQDEKVQNKQKETLKERYNVTNSYQIPTVKNRIKKQTHSKIADDMCKTIDNILGNPEYTRYFTKNGEYCIIENSKRYYYDFANTKYKYIIEFQGSYWHGLRKNQEYVYSTPVEEIYKRDKEKRILAEKNGYKVFYVYEDEYKSNKSKCLENLLKEIKNYVHSLENVI